MKVAVTSSARNDPVNRGEGKSVNAARRHRNKRRGEDLHAKITHRRSRVPHPEHLPRSSSQLTMGRFSYQGIMRLHEGRRNAWDFPAGCPRGMRWMQALRKEPMMAPQHRRKDGKDRFSHSRGKLLLDQFAEDVEEKLMRLLNAGRHRPGHEEFDLRSARGKTAAFSEKHDGLHFFSASLFDRGENIREICHWWSVAMRTSPGLAEGLDLPGENYPGRRSRCRWR